jgi:hypothetical protein
MPKPGSIATLALAVALIAAAPAAAKEPQSAKLCGPNGCTTSTDEGELRGIMQNGGPGIPPPSAGRERSYAVDVTFRGDEREIVHVKFRHYPALRLNEWDDGSWSQVPSEYAPVFADLIGRADARAGGRTFEWWWVAAAAAAIVTAAVAAALWRRRGRVLAAHPEGA